MAETTTPPPDLVTLARSAEARIITAALEATAEAAEMERSRLKRDGKKIPPWLRTDPERIREFVRGEAYRELLQEHIAGRGKGHMLIAALELLKQRLPLLFQK